MSAPPETPCPRQGPPEFILTMEKTRMGFLAPILRRRKRQLLMQRPGVSLSDRVPGGLALAPREVLPSLGALSLPLLCHTDVCVLSGLHQAPLCGSFWPNITAAIANATLTMLCAKHCPRHLVNNNSFILHNGPMK